MAVKREKKKKKKKERKMKNIYKKLKAYKISFRESLSSLNHFTIHNQTNRCFDCCAFKPQCVRRRLKKKNRNKKNPLKGLGCYFETISYPESSGSLASGWSPARKDTEVLQF